MFSYFKIFWWNLPSTESNFCREKVFHPVLHAEDMSRPVPPSQVEFISHLRKAHPKSLQQEYILLVNTQQLEKYVWIIFYLISILQ